MRVPNLLRNLRLGRFHKSDDGQALVIAGLAMVGLLLMAGMGVDVGYLHYQKQQMQKAADAGALAAASALVYGGNYVNAATNDTKANGFTADQILNNKLCAPTGSQICVAVNNPPLTPNDPFYNVPGYVEVIVAQARPTFFMKVGGWSSVNVASHAVATTTASGSGCIFSLDPTDAQSFWVKGNVTIGSSCGIYVNSNNAGAIWKDGKSGSITASYIGVVGGDKVNGGFQFECSSGLPTAGCPSEGIAQFQDPFANVSSPTPQACGTGVFNSKTNTFSPGAYCSGINISGGGTYTFQPGQYTIMQGINVTGTPTLNGSGVLFYLTGNAANPYGGVNIGGNATVNLTAETSGAQQGILFFQDRSICNPASSSCAQSNYSSFSGNSGNSFGGAFYFPTTQLIYSGTPGQSDAAVLIAYMIELNGDAQLNDSLLPASLPGLSTALLVE